MTVTLIPKEHSYYSTIATEGVVPPPPQTPPNLSTFETFLITGVGGLLVSLGVPKLLQLWGATRAEVAIGERRKEDAITKAALENMNLVLNSLIEVNRTTVGLLSSGKEEQWQAIATLINELREERLDRQKRDKSFEEFLKKQAKMLENQERLNYGLERVESYFEQKSATTRVSV